MELNQPLMNFAFLISKGDSDSLDLVQIEAWVVLMEVRGDPAHPHTAGLLTREDPHRVEVLQEDRQVRSQWLS